MRDPDPERWAPLVACLWFIAVIVGFCVVAGWLPSRGSPWP